MKLKFNDSFVEVPTLQDLTPNEFTKVGELFNSLDFSIFDSIPSEEQSQVESMKLVTKKIDVSEINTKLEIAKLSIDKDKIIDKNLLKAIKSDITSQFWQSQSMREVTTNVFTFRSSLYGY